MSVQKSVVKDSSSQCSMGKMHVVTSGQGAERAVQHIMLGEPVIGLACTGVSLGPKGQLSLVVLTTGEGDAFVFDVKKYPDIMYQGLGRLLQSVHVLKVVHDCGPVASCLHAQFGIYLKNVFDTQVAYSVMLEKQGLCPRRLPFQALCEKCDIPQYTPSPHFQKLLSEDINAWARRPLNQDMLNTAAASALPLVPTLYQHMLKALKKDSWDLFHVISDNTGLSPTHPRPSAQSPAQSRRHKSDEGPCPPPPVVRMSQTQRALIKDTLPPCRQRLRWKI
ncbi:piRNA biogenesis protein EXD1-like isoform X2 [Babylonia areolata]|uniref:piRNA biogenesis protein EXD1-like isoform X2 n=1 Tax=Babylonia areolata TaxID=304850 RepID=UPI003FD433AF